MGDDAHVASLALEERDLDSAIRKTTCGARTRMDDSTPERHFQFSLAGKQMFLPHKGQKL